MKISSASKKVLASALSAAMVVAFAPAAALAAPANVDPAKYVTVTYDANGGDKTAKPSDTLQLQEENGKYYLNVTETYAGTSNGYAFSKWFIDADGDGILDAGEKSVEGGYIEVSADTTAVTLKAAFATPALTAGTFSSIDNTIAFTIDKSGTAGHEYQLTVKDASGTTVGEQAFGGAKGADVSYMNNADYTTVAFVENPTSTDKMEAYTSFLKSGAYTATLTDGGKVISTCDVELASLTVKDGINTVADDDVVSLWQLDNGKAEASVSLDPGVYLVDGNGYAVNASAIAMKGDTVVYTTDTVQVPSAFIYDEAARTATVTLADATAKADDSYAVSVAGPDGSAVYSATVKAVDNGGVTIPAVAFSFDQSYAGARAAKAEAAGTYTVTVTKTAKADKAVTTSKKDMVLSEVAYDLGDGKAVKGAVTDSFTDEAKVTLATFGSIATEPKGYSFDKWSFGGKTYDSGAEVKLEAGKVNTVAAAYKAIDYASTPTCTVSKVAVGAGTEYYMTITGTATGETVTYSIEDGSSDVSYTGPFKLTSGKDVTVKVSASKKTEVEVTYEDVTDVDKLWSTVTSGGSSVFELTIGNSSTKWLAASGVASAIASGKTTYTALAEKLWATSDELKDTYNATFKALYEAVAAEADAQVAAYADEALVAAGSKAWTMAAKTYAAALKTVAAEEKKVADAEAAKTINAEAYLLGAQNVIEAANRALKTATEDKSVTAADIKAASDVTASLKAATDEASAKAALEAYNALTDAQKKLVATADVTAAQKIVADAEAAKKLADEQDEKAVKYCNSTKTKTIKLAKKAKKTKKKFSVKWNSQVSESGNAVTYAKVSGAKVTVSANGKATLKKGVKKGTYKAKVKVTCGNATRTVTAKFIVK